MQDLEDIADIKGQYKNIVITGGEPLLYCCELSALVAIIKREGIAEKTFLYSTLFDSNFVETSVKEGWLDGFTYSIHYFVATAEELRRLNDNLRRMDFHLKRIQTKYGKEVSVRIAVETGMAVMPPKDHIFTSITQFEMLPFNTFCLPENEVLYKLKRF
jgi:pyruvate-formate lyase-activating enzyme